ncbi:MAG: MATE family efflux transporter [Roseburia sp.]|nr:MATE family efflux transporter [Anaeroplasma bactoclasticum]MCM1196962.1 MATE family efflux transporter [Roseburia sp.]MCM1556689.1 MATE family efflux transporter [Anaeroplasma bactoclasticum]
MKITDEKRRNLILNGNMWKVVIAICAPLFIYNLFNSLYTLVDSIFANEISTDSVSSVAALGQIKNLLSSFGSGLAAGGAILVARCFGAGEYIKARKYANVLVTLVSVVVAVLAMICIPLAYPICKASGISQTQATASTGYFIIQIIELLFIAYNNVFIALQKSKGNTKSIFYLNFVTMGVKLLLNVIFIYGFHVNSIIWIGVATLISQITLFVILGIMMLRKNNIFRISIKEFSLSWEYIKPILLLSIPIFLGKFVFSFGKVAVNSIFGTRYLEILKSQIDITDPVAVASAEASAGLVVGALAVSNNIDGIATTPINSFEETESTIISQNLGNRNLKRALECFVKSFILATILGFLAWILIRFILQNTLIGLYSQDQNPEKAEEFMKYVKTIHNYDSWSIPSLAINAGVLGVLYGFGKTKLTMFINIARAFVFRIPILVLLLYCFPQLGVECAGLSMGISNICIALMSIISLVIFLIQIKKKGYQGMYLNKEQEENISQVEIEVPKIMEEEQEHENI